MKGTGGPNGVRVRWPIGFDTMRPDERVTALRRGYWLHEGEIVHRDGWKLPYSPSMRKSYPL